MKLFGLLGVGVVVILFIILFVCIVFLLCVLWLILVEGGASSSYSEKFSATFLKFF